MVKLKSETEVTVDAADMMRILTDSLCSYGALDGLRASYVKQNAQGDFDITFEPIPAETKEQK